MAPRAGSLGNPLAGHGRSLFPTFHGRIGAVDSSRNTNGSICSPVLYRRAQEMNSPRSLSALEDRVRLVRVRIFFGHANGNMLSIMVGAVLMIVVLHGGGVAMPTLVAWGLLVGVASAGVSLFERHVARVGISGDNCRRLARIRIGLGAGIALFYGLAGFLLPAPAPTQDTFLFIILSSIVTIGALGYAVMPSYYITLDLVSLFLLTAHFVRQHLLSRDSYYLLLITVAIVWQVLVLVKARRASKTAIEAIVLNERLQDEIEQHRQTREAIRQMALHDELTGLGNRRYFEESIRRALSRAARDGTRFGLLAVDMNQFKPINDCHGHATGDAVLKIVAERLLGGIRSGDFCARMGGDEFSIIVAGVTSEADVVDVAAKVHALLAQPVRLGDLVLATSASVGWAVYPEDGRNVAELLSVADRRMYGRKQVCNDQTTTIDA